MMKTALSIVQSVRKRLNLPAITALVGATDPDELQMIELLYAVCEELRQARCWTQLKRSYSFATVATQASYQLPADFYSPLLNTHWNATEDERLIGPVTDDDFMYLTESGSSSTQNYTFRIFGRDENTASGGGQFYVNPTPSAVQTLKFEYLTRSFLLPKNWAASTAFGAGAYCNASGNIYQTAAGGTSGATVPSHTTGSVADGAGGVTWTYISAAYETLVADTDLVIFDSDLVALGLRAKWLEESGGEYQQALAEYEDKIDRAVSRYRGPIVGSQCGGSAKRRYSVTPLRSWSL